MRNKLTYIAAFLILVSFTATKAQVSEPFKNPFPSPLSVAHTWNRSLTKKAGQMLGEQWAKEGMKEVNAPNLTVVQPRYNQCCLNFYGESPYLTAETGVEMVKGLQNKEQLKAFLVFDEKERQAPYVRPYQRVLDEAHAAGIATEAQIQSSANKKTKTLPVSDEFKKTALQVAHESIVLLKNAGNILPVDTAWVKSIAVCGQQELVNDMKVSLEQTLACKVIVTENTEEASKVAALSSKLEWAKMVDEMSDSSKVLVLKEPQKLRDFEYSSPKLLMNILLGIVFGFLASLFAVIFAENTDKKLTYSMLGDNIIYNLENDFSDLKLFLLANQDKKVSIAVFENIPQDTVEQLREFKNVNLVKADITEEFVQNIKNSEEIVIFATVGKTSSKLYKQIKTMLSEMNKKISQEVLI